MPQAPLPDDLAIEAVRLRDECGGNISEAARRKGVPRPTFQNWLTRAAARGLDGSVPKSLPPGQTIKGVSTLYNAEGQVAAQWVKTKAEPSVEDTAEAIRAALADYDGKSVILPAPDHCDTALATVYIGADWHLGALSWAKETGHNYDLKIAEGVIKSSLSRLVASAPNSSQAVVLGLGDLLHADGYEPTTSRSKNLLDVDGRYPRVLETATRLILFKIDLALQKHDQVLARILPGNHDDQSAIAVALAVSMFYSNNDRVTIDTDPGRFWWWSWGKVLLGATHGDMAKMKDLPLIMAARNPDAWGKSKFRHIYTGHIHTQTGIEMSGVTVESFQTPAAPDAWHIGMGYGAGRSMPAITLHKEHGEISRNRVNIV